MADEMNARGIWLKARLGLHLPTIEKTGQAHNYAYAKLPDILTAVGPALREAGFAVRFETWSPDPETLGVRCLLTHAVSGHSESSEMVVQPSKLGMSRQNEMQVRGSAITYACRYCLLCLLGTAPEVDDDAQTDPPIRTQARETPYVRSKREAAEEADDDCPF